jgi:hypothetical protein
MTFKDYLIHTSRRIEMEPVKIDELYSGMKLWDNENKRWQKVLRVYLWEDIIKKNPDKFYAKKPRQ